MARKVRIDMARERYGRLVGLEFSHIAGGHAHWLFQCDCGTRTIVNGAAVRSGKTASCGCLHRQICAERLTRHGQRARRRHGATYRAWQEINTFCTNPNSARYRDFGARGIRVCGEWATDFEAFARDMGERPAATILSRRGPARDFTPANCRWTPLRSRADRALAGRRREPAGAGAYA